MVLALVAVAAAWPALLASRDPSAVHPTSRLSAPSVAHPFGTDELGRDVLARVVHGARPSLEVGLGAVAIGLLVGGSVGLLCGLSRGWPGALLARTLDVLLAFPSLLLALTIISISGAGTGNIALALGIASLPVFARIVRGEVLRVRDQPHIDGAVAAGVRRTTIAYRHILPNIAAPIVAFAGLAIGVEILTASSLSFLGFGPLPPAADWGTLISAGRDYLSDAWWITFFPGLVIVATVIALGRLSTLAGGTPWRPAP
ncbi:ABC transporter permease [Frankia sp. QA3]|uniref:ABC transporter permease n=1 Tax=Frankia sp. QA3 TaxID=710111 RepID=UPI0012F8ACBE|nr:ABC transporter permease [Frankia sp. QA3]